MPDAVSNPQYKSMTPVRFLALGLASALIAASAPPEFEVATVKQSPPPEGDRIQINLGRLLNGKLTFGNATLSDCLKYAYGIVSDAQLVGPDWIKSGDVRFDIVAQAPGNTTHDQIDLMLQSLLAERLKVSVHHEQRGIPHLALIVGKNGPRLKASTSNAGNTAARGRITANNMQMSGLATLLSRFERQTIVDKTGLTGYFEFKLEYTPDDRLKADDSSGPSLFTAIQEQLGLKLESQKGPLDILVVDHAEKTPTDN